MGVFNADVSQLAEVVSI